MPDHSAARAAQTFQRAFGSRPAAVAHAPGRVNLIGDHTDYNGGHVLPLALEHGTAAAYQARDDFEVHCVSADLGQTAVIGPGDLGPGASRPSGWRAYLRGALVEWRAFIDRGGNRRALRGANIAVKTALPIGAGLSSSAAFEVAVLRALCAVNGIRWRAQAMAEVARAAENRHAGVQCGIMDPLCAAAARAAHALSIDCRSLRRRHIKLPPGWRVVVMDTATRRDLQTSDYNRRRAECEQAAAALGAASLREVSETRLERARAKMDAVLYRRARHVITENQRARRAKAALENADAGAVGELFAQSQRSMTRDFQVGGDALNAMVAAAQTHPACHAARQTGAGFAGCAVALVDAGADDFTAVTARRYRRRTGLTPAFYATRGGGGAAIFPLDGLRDDR